MSEKSNNAYESESHSRQHEDLIDYYPIHCSSNQHSEKELDIYTASNLNHTDQFKEEESHLSSKHKPIIAISKDIEIPSNN